MKGADIQKLDDLFELREVRGKWVFIVDDHHKAFAAWAYLRRERANAPILISFDHHTDTLPACGHRAAVTHPNDDDAYHAFRAEMVAKLGWSTDTEVLTSVAALKHDEHIDAAATCGILRASFSIQLSDMVGWLSVEQNAYYAELEKHWDGEEIPVQPKRPFSYKPPEHNVFVVGHECFIGCEARPHNDACEPVHASQIIESVYVEDQLARVADMARCIGIEGGIETVPYILDVDLDVFHTVASVHPQDAASFHRLIRGALAITIATEAEWVAEEWLDEERQLSSDELLVSLVQHIDQALA
jgi:hypothetical protein